MVFQHILPFYVMILYHHGGKDQAQILKPASSPLARNIIKIQNSILGGTAKINVTIKDLKVQRWSSSHPQLSHHLALQKQARSWQMTVPNCKPIFQRRLKKSLIYGIQLLNWQTFSFQYPSEMRIRSSPDFCGWTAVCVHDHAPRMLVLQLSDTILCDHLDILQNITLVNYNDYSMLVKLEQQQVIRKLILENMSNRRWEINPIMIQRYTILVKLGESSCLEHAGVYMLQSCL